MLCALQSAATPQLLFGNSEQLLAGQGPSSWRVIIESSDPRNGVLEIDTEQGMIRIPLEQIVLDAFSDQSGERRFLVLLLQSKNDEGVATQQALFVAQRETIRLFAAGFQLLLDDPSNVVSDYGVLSTIRLDRSLLERLR
ncbi:MAG: hypothetical protein P9M14_16785 [Candidatus Alcyoniella australis]|nr:hypothetical protein [Candidatus Alcyoniella australis]